MALRPYQEELLEQVTRELSGSRDAKLMLQLPTGGGKTRIAGQLLSELLNGGRKAVWLTHRRELAAQTEEMLQEDGVTATKDINWEPGSVAPAIPNGAVILMAQTVARRTARADVWGRYNGNDLMIIDEAHHATADGWTRAMKQWPGPVVGMTATPWRLSKREGFDHLFAKLVCGPQVAALQSDGWMCTARVMSPPEGDLVVGGLVDATTGDYSESGIEEANRDREVWTGGAVRFWQRHAEGRQTVVYAVSVRHALNLADVFKDAGIPAGALVADTPDFERTEIMRGFRAGNLRVLVNVAVATEGFDLPDAACVLLTRPTMSLALYLQMVGRGLRPKPDSGDCIVLDLAGNSLVHGLPESDRVWSLRARGEEPQGDARLIRCESCEALSPAGNHFCDHCGEPFGEHCGRCGAWRAWKRWTGRHASDEEHEQVCDLCHYDAHLLAKLPVTDELEELAKMRDDDELSPHRNPYLKDMLEEEQRRLGGSSEARKEELRHSIDERESDFADDAGMKQRFRSHLDSLADIQRPAGERQWWGMYFEWEDKYRAETERLKGELASLATQTVDGQLVLRNVREKLVRLLETEAREAGLVTREPIQAGTPLASMGRGTVTALGEELDLIGLDEWLRSSYSLAVKPRLFRDSNNAEISIDSWSGLLRETAESLIRQGLLTERSCPVSAGGTSNKYVIHTEPLHPGGRGFRGRQRLSNGLWFDAAQGSGDRIARLCLTLAQRLGADPTRFHVQLATTREAGAFIAPQSQVPAPLGGAFAELPANGEWVSFRELTNRQNEGLKLRGFRGPHGYEKSIEDFRDLPVEVAEWLIQERLLEASMGRMWAPNARTQYLIHNLPQHSNGSKFQHPKQLSNGLFIEAWGKNDRVAKHVKWLVEKFGRNPAEFHVLFAP